MILLPAIDLLDKKCVRLRQGDYKSVSTYSNNPSQIAVNWTVKGADYLHVVDLNGADQDFYTNMDVIKQIAEETNIPIQVGGGIRNLSRATNLLNSGVTRIIIGTVAIENKELLRELVGKYKERIVVSIDSKDGKVATRGWKELSEVESLSFCKYLESIGIRTIVYTDISRDGMLSGPNIEIYKKLVANTNLNVIASGGISRLNDLKILKSIGVYGSIIGKALYENQINLEEAIECLRDE